MDLIELEEKIKKAPLVSFESLLEVSKKSGVYTAWLEGELRCFYIGRSKNLSERIKQHFLGSRGSDQFCLYVYDLYLHDKRPEGLSTKDVNMLTQTWIRKNIKFRCVETSEEEANELEKDMKTKWKPILSLMLSKF